MAINELFKSIANNDSGRIRYELERKLLAFTAANQSARSQELAGLELAKVKNYADAMEDIRARNRKLEAMGGIIAKNIPKLDKSILLTIYLPSTVRSATLRFFYLR